MIVVTVSIHLMESKVQVCLAFLTQIIPLGDRAHRCDLLNTQ